VAEQSFLEQYKLGAVDEKSHIMAVTTALAALCDAAKGIGEGGGLRRPGHI
jgi:hypothetical protein